ncbi:hypothetical protein DPMN_155581 [Dreissena polymorpha]|uniref:Uncharacterized protein n=1 Tax=Dreissena polymorpha TaxID=45954 RepID=A0A9D4JA32_DREPO|nr:hypothetical protein DPMN_155581 [Dreissena polymorpha]
MPIQCGFKLRVLCVNRQSVSVVLRLAIALSLLTLLGGDVEQNPRPTTKNTKQLTLPFSEMPASEAPPLPSSHRTTKTRANKADNDSEVSTLLREMKVEMKNDLLSINSKINDICNTLNILKNKNEQLRQENISMNQKLSNLSSKLDRLEGHSRRNNLRLLAVEGRVSESWEETE